MAGLGLLMLGACIPPPVERASDRAPQVALPPGYDQLPPATPAAAQTPVTNAAPDGQVALPPRPAWEARPVTPDALDVAAQTYTVQPGDTLRAIAAKTGAGSEAIARANGLIAPFIIKPGQPLKIPGGRYHLVRAGETGIAIARAYGVPWRQVVADNALEEPFILRAGQRVLIPRLTPQTPAERADALMVDIEDIVTGGEPAVAATARPAAPTDSPARVLPPETSITTPARFAGGWSWPARGQIVRRFGPGASGERNDGIKIALPLQTPVVASADGVVAYSGNSVAGLGGLVMLKHGDGWSSFYGHVGQILVQRGQSVKRGQTIALSGDSGFADRPELHFELRKGRTPVDPASQLPRQ